MIKGISGFGLTDEAYTEKIAITSEAISYIYNPEVESDFNSKRKWSYKTTSEYFKMVYSELVNEILAIIDGQLSCDGRDGTGIELIVTYADKTEFKELYWCADELFENVFIVLSKLIPEIEEKPKMLLGIDDFNG